MLNSEHSLVVKTFNVLANTQHLVIHILSEVRYVKFKFGFHISQYVQCLLRDAI